MYMIKLYKTYNKAKDVFKRPKLKVFFGLWKNNPFLPFWRRGYRISLSTYKNFYHPTNSVYYKEYSAGDVKPDGTVCKYNTYNISTHKLPNGVINGVWKRDIRKKLRKYGLGWIKPQYFLPIWLSFYVFNFDVIYKWKYDTIRFEFPPQFTIVLFGISLTLILCPILEDDDDNQDHYWESLLSYLYQEECNKNITDTLNFCGKWRTYKNGVPIDFFQLRKTHIKPEYHQEYDIAAFNYNSNKNDDK